MAESAKLIRLKDEAWQGLSGLVGTGENIQGSQLSLESLDLACSQDSSLRLFPSSKGPSFHPFSVWGVDRTEPPNRASQNMHTHIYPHACVDTDLSYAFFLSLYPPFPDSVLRARPSEVAVQPSQQPWDQPPVLEGKGTPPAFFFYFIEAFRAPKDKPQEMTHILLQKWFPFPLLLGLETIPAPSPSPCSGEELLRP